MPFPLSPEENLLSKVLGLEPVPRQMVGIAVDIVQELGDDFRKLLPGLSCSHSWHPN